MIPTSCFPLPGSTFELRMDVRPLPASEGLLAPDDLRAAHLRYKQILLEEDHAYCFRALPGAGLAQQEAVALLRPLLPRHALLDASLAPLDALGRHTQEDLLLLDASLPGIPLVAGQLCFPNAWSLEEKLGKSLLQVHAPVPGYETNLAIPLERLLAKMQPGRHLLRFNWGLVAWPDLDLSSRCRQAHEKYKALVTPADAGQRVYLRVERQTLAKLPESQHVLFLLHTYIEPLASVLERFPFAKERLTGTLLTAPPETLAYKGITPMLPAILSWLSSQP